MTVLLDHNCTHRRGTSTTISLPASCERLPYSRTHSRSPAHVCLSLRCVRSAGSPCFHLTPDSFFFFFFPLLVRQDRMYGTPEAYLKLPGFWCFVFFPPPTSGKTRRRACGLPLRVARSALGKRVSVASDTRRVFCTVRCARATPGKSTTIFRTFCPRMSQALCSFMNSHFTILEASLEKNACKKCTVCDKRQQNYLLLRERDTYHHSP